MMCLMSGITIYLGLNNQFIGLRFWLVGFGLRFDQSVSNRLFLYLGVKLWNILS